MGNGGRLKRSTAILFVIYDVERSRGRSFVIETGSGKMGTRRQHKGLFCGRTL
jgi:hypothetical protein